MKVQDQDLERIVQQVLQSLRKEGEVKDRSYTKGVFENMEEAIAASIKTQEELRRMPMEFREKIIANIRKKTLQYATEFAQMGVKETGMGRVGDKILKHQLVAERTPGTEDIQVTAWSGDRGLTLIEQGPFGVIGAVTPSTNPSETIICNTIGMIAGGNTVVFNPHPGAIQVSNYAVSMVNEASMEVGGPNHIATSVIKPTLGTADILFKHPKVPLLVATGGPGVVTSILSSGKRGIGAGAGNPPVVVDETADIPKAAMDIINGATFDNNLPCIAEKEVIVVKEVADELIHYMIQSGSYLLEESAVEQLTNMVLEKKDGRLILNRNWVGKDASAILAGMGIIVDDSIRCIIFNAPKDHPLVVEELMMPILGIVRVEDVDEAIEVATILEQGNRHSAHMHSKNVDNLTRFGQIIDTAIFVKNAPSYAALGFGGEGYCTFTIASRTGEGLTSPRTFTKSRRCVMADSLCIR
ncbi:MAG: aldehyde dehydrogenase EutE [Epulopiscium sp.]|nr:aldehyde dehydrogenase EutE [Candidatus Epulonipiscium sp.]